ncbi:hypothetical protein Leryth_020882 [Lithospermum erythrorhizon]|nr:hypothetical protein Leryth_020882 [Lithospermum erythrorhizon]
MTMVPGQRSLALHLLASVLDRAARNILKNRVGTPLNHAGDHGSIDWEAIWGFALGPEPELALARLLHFPYVPPPMLNRYRINCWKM